MFAYPQAAVLSALLAQGLAIPFAGRSDPLEDSPDAALQSRAKISFSVPATCQSSYNNGWTIPMQVGNQNYQVRMDTGSSTFWLLSDKLEPNQRGSGHTIYATSADKQVAGETYDGTYVDGTGSTGLVYTDTLVIGAATVTSQAVGAATSVSSVKNGPNSGMLGLSFASNQNMSPTLLSTPAKNLMSQLIDPVIAMDLRNAADGSVSFGATDPAKYTGAITYVQRSTSSSSAWNVPVSAAYVNGNLIPIQFSVNALVDTGTTLFRMPQAVVDNYYSSVPGAVLESGSYKFPCSNVRNHIMPSFGVKLGDRVATVPGDYMWYAPIDSTYCRGALQPTSSGNYLGDMFLRTQYVVFNYAGTGSVGFATKANLQPPPSL